MKQRTLPIALILVLFFISSCSTMIPMQANLSDQTLLLADNKNLKIEPTLTSNVDDGSIQTISVLKNGSESSSTYYEYKSKTAFNRIWGEYFGSKYNNFSKDTLYAEVTLNRLYLKTSSANSIGAQVLTGNTKFNQSAEAEIYVKIRYKGKEYENLFTASASEYNETQTVTYGDVTTTYSQSNPMQQRAVLLEDALNKSIIQFDNFIESLLLNVE
jgi:hypothetical protein